MLIVNLTQPVLLKSHQFDVNVQKRRSERDVSVMIVEDENELLKELVSSLKTDILAV